MPPALGTVEGCVPTGIDYCVAEWRRAASEVPALGLDLIEAQLMWYNKDTLRRGSACRFHDYGQEALTRDTQNSEWLCPFSGGGCFSV